MITFIFFIIGTIMAIGPWFVPADRMDIVAKTGVSLFGVIVLGGIAITSIFVRLYRKASANMAFVKTGMGAPMPSSTGPDPGPARVEPDARHPRLPPRPDVPGDLRDAGSRDHPRRDRRSRSHGDPPLVEIMHPLVGFQEELRRLRDLTIETADEEGDFEYLVGTMIELPRACIRADEIAEQAELFSFGTNDLTADRARVLARRRRGQVPDALPPGRRARAEPVRDARPESGWGI